MNFKNQLLNFFRNPRILILAGIIIFLSFVSIGLAFWVNLIAGLTMIIMVIVAGAFSIRTLRVLDEEANRYITDLSFRINRSEEDATLEMPMGILIYSDEDRIEWVNPFLQTYFGNKQLLGRPIAEVDDELNQLIDKHSDSTEPFEATWRDHTFQFTIRPRQRTVYLIDITKYSEMESAFKEQQIVIGQIYLDNYDEITQSMTDSVKSNLNNFITNQVSNWASEFGMYLKRVDSDQFFVIMYNETLKQVEKANFKLLDVIREATSKQNAPVTLSMGIAYGNQDLNALADLSQSNLDLALGRGGDQVVVKAEDEPARFYGGKTNPMEKRTRVRARMISQAVQELMNQSDQVFVMGHSRSDLDSIGASLGIRRIAEMNQKQCWIVLDDKGLHSDVQRLVRKLEDNEDIKASIITGEEALEKATDQSLLVMVDHSKESITISTDLYERLSNHVIIIDHHRRGTEFPENPELVYIEPYASSTCELITEMFEYQSTEGKPITSLEATGMLAGIEVDTKSFTERTGTRTFDAASYLRSVGANEDTIRELLKENVDSYLQRNHLVEAVKFINNIYAVSVGEDEREYDPVIAAQAADSLMKISGVAASFIITRRSGDTIGISARSDGNVSVQIIMEEMGGGGHLSMAATQLKDITVEEARQQLVALLDKQASEDEEEE